MATKTLTRKKKSSQQSQVETFDLKKKKEFEQFRLLSPKQAWVANNCCFEKCMRDGAESPLRYGKGQLFLTEGEKSVIYMSNNGKDIVVLSTQYLLSPSTYDDHKEFIYDIDSDILYSTDENDDYEVAKLANSNKFLINGDMIEGGSYHVSQFNKCVTVCKDVDDSEGIIAPTVSYNCIGRFYGVEEDPGYIKNLLHKGTLQMLDCTFDETKKISAKELKLIQKNNQAKPPQPGFTLVNNTWHRPASVLLVDTKKNMYLLLGQDEGSYFGVELPKPVKTVGEALESLMPEEAKGKIFHRQGEWFFIEVDESEVPTLLDIKLSSDDQYNENKTLLPLESDDSNHHIMRCSKMVVGNDGEVYVYAPTVEHDQHDDLNVLGWHIYRRNTALRSFSQEGVD